MQFNHRKYHASPVVHLPDRQWPNQVFTKAPRWVSVDLRDGNQALRSPMTVTRKQQLWQLLIKLGFKEIEVGFPAASQPDYDFVRWLIEQDQIPADVWIQVLTQARADLIERTFTALQGAPRAIVHVYNSISPIQRSRVFNQDRAGIMKLAMQGAEWVANTAAHYSDTHWRFQYSPESFSQTELDYAVEVIQSVLNVWQPTSSQPCIINLPATVESNSPNVFADQVEYVKRALNHDDRVILSIHTHNDRGCAVAATELALLAGAERVEGTLLGNGERTGNVDIMTLAMNLYSQGIDPELDMSNPDEIITVIEDCTGIACHPRHPWVGELVYTAFSGSHQDAIRKCLQQQTPNTTWQVAYLPIDPRDLGRDYSAVIRVNSQSGKAGLAFVLEREYGLLLPRWIQQALAPIVQYETEQQGGMIDAQRIRTLFEQTFICDQAPVQLLGYQLQRNGHDDMTARLMVNHQEIIIHGTGSGALAAFIAAWCNWSGQLLDVRDYYEQALGAGTDADAVAYVLLADDANQNAAIAGVAIDRDTVSAALKAVISAVNLRQLQLVTSD
ncbi:2-isopropylmalate synthase [Thiospirillum jenense]|nr:2-isopropylmalate synthase [Thiospirillum jenense]